MKKILVLVAVATLLAGLLAFGRSRHAAPSKPIASGYTVDFTVVENGELVSRKKRQVKANGDFLEETDHLNADGSVSKHTRLAGTLTGGAQVIDDARKKLTFLGRAGLITAVTEAELRAQKDYNRDDLLLGFKVIVQRSCDEQKRCTEYWVAPELGSDDLKVDIDFGDGHRLTTEAVKVVKGEPSFQIPDYPVEQGSRLANPGRP